jgi:methionyl-tRNA formyltransferase
VPDLTTVFAGSPAFAATILERLAASPFRPIAVYTQPDRAQGRGRKVKPNAVKKLARKLDIDVVQPESLRDAGAVEDLSRLQPDVLIVAAYGLILPVDILAVPTYGCLNVHASLLPRWRGAAPIERAIMAGDSETGVCIMQMEAGLDTGPVFVSTHIPINRRVQSSELEQQLAEQGAADLIGVLDQFNAAHRGDAEIPHPSPQDEQKATYAHKLTNLDRSIDWGQSAEVIARQVRALSARLPVRVQISDCGVQLIDADWIEQSPLTDGQLNAGTIVDASKSGIIVQCETDLLQINAVKVEKGKGSTLDPAAAVNGCSDLFHVGARLV